MWTIIIGILVGASVPVQTGINNQLKKYLNSTVIATAISFTIGTIFLFIIYLLTSQSLKINFNSLNNQPWWIWLGGVLGIFYPFGTIILFPHLGSTQTVILPIFGQILMGLLTDNFGWFGLATHNFTFIRFVGIILIIIGLILFIRSQNHSDFVKRVSYKTGPHKTGSPLSLKKLSWQLSGILIGILEASQVTINGRLNVVFHSPLEAGIISFAISAFILWIFTLGHKISSHKNFHFQVNKSPWWIWLGGFLGGIIIIGNAYLAPIIGTALSVVLVMLGMLIGSLLIDNYGWLKATRRPITLVKTLGILVMLGGICLIKFLN